MTAPAEPPLPPEPPSPTLTLPAPVPASGIPRRDIEAAGAAAAADRLDQDAVAVVAFGIGRAGDVGRDRLAVAAAAARAADADIDAASAGAGRIDRTPVTLKPPEPPPPPSDWATMPRAWSPCVEAATRSAVGSVTSRLMSSVTSSPLPPRPPDAADADIDRCRRRAADRNPAGDVEAARAAAAADRLGEHAVAALALSVGRAGDADVDRAGRAAAAARAADPDVDSAGAGSGAADRSSDVEAAGAAAAAERLGDDAARLIAHVEAAISRHWSRCSRR